MEYKRHRDRRLRHWLSIPIVYLMIVPLVIMDLFAEIYHRICFKLYGIPYLKRSKYIRIDRQKLKYLNWWDKINCAYCGYANGLAHYLTEMGAETEKYWCGIMHKKYKGFLPPEHHEEFLKYGDEKGFKRYIGKK